MGNIWQMILRLQVSVTGIQMAPAYMEQLQPTYKGGVKRSLMSYLVGRSLENSYVLFIENLLLFICGPLYKNSGIYSVPERWGGQWLVLLPRETVILPFHFHCFLLPYICVANSFLTSWRLASSEAMSLMEFQGWKSLSVRTTCWTFFSKAKYVSDWILKTFRLPIAPESFPILHLPHLSNIKALVLNKLFFFSSHDCLISGLPCFFLPLSLH